VRTAALIVSLGAVGFLTTAPASLAATQQPPVGLACQPDGKINGAGSTFQSSGINFGFTYGYQQDVCGPQTSASNLFFNSFPSTWTSPEGNGVSYTVTPGDWGTTDPSVFSFKVGIATNNVDGMVAYNWGASRIPTVGVWPTTSGSGAGLNRLSCRMDMFDGTDLPYNNSQLAAIDSTPGSLTAGTNPPWTTPPYKCDTYADAGGNSLGGFNYDDSPIPDHAPTFTGITNVDQTPPPYGPQSYGAWPAGDDVAADAMTLPVAGGAVAFVANLASSPTSTSGGCTTTPPAGTVLDLTPSEFDGIWQGTINQWNDSVLGANNPFLFTYGCTGPIQRVVPEDSSGTTAITMFTLNGFDQGALCAAGTKGSNLGWYGAATQSDNTGYWPLCSNNPVSSIYPGTNALIAEVAATPGGIGGAELGLWNSTHGVALGSAGFPTAHLGTTAAPTTYLSPGNLGEQSNCLLPSAPPTGATATAAVGLGARTWSNSGSAAQSGAPDIADAPGSYPACGLTFDMVYTGQNEANEVASPTAGVFTPGCQITAPTPASATGGQTLPVTTLNVGTTAGFPPSGTLSVDGQTLTYTSVTSTSFSGLSGGTSGTIINAGDRMSLVSTRAPATATTPGMNGACQTVGDSLSGITNDQLRTLYSYFTYIFTPLGQENLPNQGLDQLPAPWLQYLEQGFQQNF